MVMDVDFFLGVELAVPIEIADLPVRVRTQTGYLFFLTSMRMTGFPV